MRYVPPKRRLTLNGLHDVISQKTVFLITTGVKTSNPTEARIFSWYGEPNILTVTAAIVAGQDAGPRAS
jgi:hypothetical protein